MSKRFFLLLAVCLSGFVFRATVRAGTDDVSKSSVVPVEQADSAFRKGSFDLQAMSGVIFSIQRTTYLRPNVDYDLSVIRLGYMLDNVYGHGFFRGNDEVMLEAAGGSIFVGPGSGLGGLSIMYRRNFLIPSVQSRLVPYFDAAGGGIYTDAYHNKPQRALGAPGEFDLQAGLGTRLRFARNWSLDTEFDYRHLSNAGLAGRNYGTNGIGGLIGISRSF